MQKKLPSDSEAILLARAKEGREAWASRDLASAEVAFLRAWDAIPEPRAEYDYSQSLARGMVTFFRDTRQFDKVHSWVAIVRELYPPKDPAIEFLVATVHFEEGSLDAAFAIFDSLYRAYKRRPFKEQDPRYLQFFLDRAGKTK